MHSHIERKVTAMVQCQASFVRPISKLSPAGVVAALQQHDFSRPEKYMLNRGVYSSEEIVRVRMEFQRYIALASTMGEVAVVSAPIDDYWHSTILFTEEYKKMCSRTGVPFVHHYPTVGAEERNLLCNQYERTLQAYRASFGEPDRIMWPPGAQVCGGNGGSGGQGDCHN